jgi:hypothetical protein
VPAVLQPHVRPVKEVLHHRRWWPGAAVDVCGWGGGGRWRGSGFLGAVAREKARKRGRNMSWFVETITFRRRGGAGNFEAMASVGGWLARKGQLLVAPGVVVRPSLQLLACG